MNNSRDRAHALRERLRTTYGLPDTTTPEWAAEAHRQARRVAESPSEREDQAFVDDLAVQWWDDE